MMEMGLNTKTDTHTHSLTHINLETKKQMDEQQMH